MLQRCGKVVPGDVLKGPIFWLPNQLPLSSELRSFEEKCDFKAKYKGFTKETTVTKENGQNLEIQNVFSRYLAGFFELDLHIWYLGSYLNMFSAKLKVFMKKYFFESWARFWFEILTIWMGILPQDITKIWSKYAKISTKKYFFIKNFTFSKNILS